MAVLASTVPATSSPVKGMILVVVATFLFASHDAVSKYLAGFYPVLLVIWFRYFVHMTLMAAFFLPRSGLDILRTRSLKLQVLRAVSLVSTSFFFTSSLRYFPLAESTAVHFLAPLIVTLLSMPLLGERVTAKQYCIVIVGFIGTLFIVRPGGDLFSPAAVFPLCSAMCFALYQLLTRKAGAVDSPTTSNFYGGLFSTLITSALLPFYWVTPALGHLPLLVALGTLGMTSHLIFAQSFRYAPPAVLAPFGYCQIMFAGILGLLLYDHSPDPLSVCGMVIISLSGVAAIWKRRVVPPPKTISETL